jgi:hypothetical protein
VTRCPVCGGLECLCRPRFFAGQLLTEDDLNRLDHYIVAKNKLRNRYLHGVGVVCGLEVACHQCKGYVTVKSGYALSPCGDDIVLCDDQAVNVCELIQHYRQQQFECEPTFPAPQPICGDQDEDWILYVCYDEKPSRGIAPLHGGSGATCCSKCSCGGSSSCGCGGAATGGCGCGGGKKNERPAYRQVPTKALAQCEPTVVCEGYRFQLRKVPPATTKRDLGEFINRMEACFKDFTQLQITIINLNNNTQPSQIQAIKATLIALANQHSIYDCGLLQRIADISSTAPIDEVKVSLTEVNFELFKECFCSSLLPPCGPPADENCVPLATVTLNCRGGCNVVKVCNLENRRILVTLPALKYWLEGLFRLLGISKSLAKLCCEETEFQIGAVSRPDLLTGIFNQAVQQGGTISPEQVFQHLGVMFKELTVFTRQ